MAQTILIVERGQVNLVIMRIRLLELEIYRLATACQSGFFGRSRRISFVPTAGR